MTQLWQQAFSHSVFVRSMSYLCFFISLLIFLKVSDYQVNFADMLEYETSQHLNFWNIDKYG